MPSLPPRSSVTVACLLWVAAVGPVTAADPAKLTVVTPAPRQVVQRAGFDPQTAVSEKPGHPAFGFADVAVRVGPVKVPEGSVWEYRVALLADAVGGTAPWTALRDRPDQAGPGSTARVPAGGWYRLDVRCRRGDVVSHQGGVGPVGVGEVFVVAGQSYATNCHDERLRVADPQKRVVAFDAAKGTWAVADDPQPVPDGSAGGSIWPPVGDALVRALRVPVGFANVAVGATASSQWLPGGPLHKRLVEAGTTLGTFRAVLWQQGESDVIAKSTTETYVANVRAIRHAAATAWGRQPPWLLAKSTHHPTVYSDPAGEGRIRAAIDDLTARPGFRPGPDTDTLTGKYRGDAKSRRHFSPAGQAKAAELWADVLTKYLAAPPAVEEMLPDLHLLTPAWASPVVYRESSVLLRRTADGPVTARLAFPAAELLEVATADRRHRFEPGAFSLAADGLTLTFAKPGPVEPIPAAAMFVPKGSPQSYAARVGHPDQSLMYHPGRWFHDRDVEVTYRRRDKPVAPAGVVGTLPKTAARLKAGDPLGWKTRRTRATRLSATTRLGYDARLRPGARVGDGVIVAGRTGVTGDVALRRRRQPGTVNAPHSVGRKPRRGVAMADERNVAHDKKVAADKAKAAGGGVGKDKAANVDGDGVYTTEPHKKHPTQPGKKASQEDEAAENE